MFLRVNGKVFHSLGAAAYVHNNLRYLETGREYWSADLHRRSMQIVNNFARELYSPYAFSLRTANKLRKNEKEKPF